MKKKYIDTQLHGTRGSKHHAKRGLTERVVTGEGFSKRANMRYKYKNLNKKGESNTIEWII